jgi:hypothetical protein
MAGFRTDNVLACSEATYWDKIFLDDEYNRRLFLDELRFTEWRELARDQEGELLKRRVKASPHVGEVPGALKALVGDGIGYEERGTLVRKKNRYEAKAIPNRLGDKVTVTITMATTPVDAERCRLVVEGSVTAKIFVIGGLLEQRMVSDLRRSYEKSAEFTNRFAGEKGLK